MKYVTKDGKSFADLDSALKHESALDMAEKIANEERAKREELKKKIEEKRLAYNEMEKKVDVAKEAISSYNKKYNERIEMYTKLYFNNDLNSMIDNENKKSFPTFSEFMDEFFKGI